ncbi:MAG: hypothetical protein MUF42_08535 [Cytophagaceae bacterium]|nr:hypothetical protein [Cytophagaceae bacterium]
MRNVLYWMILLLLSSSRALAASPQDVISSIYKTLEKASHDQRIGPELTWIPAVSGKKNATAYYHSKEKKIYFSEDLYTLATSFGKDSTGVIAFVLGHELTHFYKGNNLTTESSSNNQQFLIQLQDEESRKAEELADYYGSVLAYMAGYEVFPVAEKFILALYQSNRLPDQTKGYPDKKERIDVLKKAERSVKKFRTLFETSQLLQAARYYEEAALCLQEIAKDYPSGDVFNNLGVLYAQEALLYSNPRIHIFQYPFTLDQQSRWSSTGKGAATEKEKKFNWNLQQALFHFEKALSISRSNPLYQINWVLANTLKNDSSEIKQNQEELMLTIKQSRNTSLKLNEKTLMALADICEGILNYRIGRGNVAFHNFNSASNSLPWFANFNKSALKAPGYLEQYERLHPPVESSNAMEKVNGIALEQVESIMDQFEDSIKVYEITAAGDGPSLKIYVLKKEGASYLFSCRSCEDDKRFFIKTNSDYKGKSLLGMKINDAATSVIGLYGNPDRLQTGNRNSLLIYDKRGLGVGVNDKGLVQYWIVF